MKQRPILRYHGGKWKLAKWIISYFPEHKVYIEPFGGAASVLLKKDRSYAEVYNDLDSEIVNVFRVLRDPEMVVEFEKVIRLTPFARDEFVLSYETSSDPVEQARRTVTRVFMGFGSSAMNSARKTGFRSNSNRSGTIPAHDWANWPDAIPFFVERLQGVVIENRPAIDVIKNYDQPEALIYADPPYVHATRKRASRRNYVHEMTDSDHKDLAEALKQANGMVFLSGYRCELYDELYGDWKRVDRKAYADRAMERTESLWMNEAAAQKVQPTLFEAIA